MRVAAVLLWVPVVAFAAGKSEPLHDDPKHLQPMDVFGLEWADRPEVSPDGESIVYMRQSFDRMKDRRRSQLWLLSSDGRRHRPLTALEDGASGAVWSPSGDRIAYVARGEDGAQVHVRWMDTGQTARLTQVKESPSNLAWSPDGRWIAFTARVPAKSEPLAQIAGKPEGAEWAEPVKLIDRLRYRFDGAGYIDPGYTHVFVVPAEGGTPRQVTQGDFDHDGVVQWLPDGDGFIVTSNRADDWEYDWVDSELYRVDVATGEATALTDRDGPDAGPVLSPDGERVAFVGFDDRKLAYQVAGLYVLDLDGGEPRALAPGFDYNIDGVAWDDNGRGLYVSYTKQGRDRIGYVSASGGDIEELVDDFGGTAMGRPYGGGAFSADGGVVAYTRGTIDRPADVAVFRRGRDARVLTDLNRDALDHKTLGQVEERWFTSSADQRRIHGWVVKPPGFEAGRKYPMLLEIHGGPHADYGPRFAPETQLYASAGYVVLYINPRGSSSYGEDFGNLIHHDYPGRDYDDLMSAVDAVIAEGYVDPQQLFVTGGSGGGVLTAWIVGSTDRFRAAVVAKPVINWTSFVLTADAYPYFTGYWFPSMPWEDPEHYFKRSPISRVGNVTTPTMLITGESDYRTPISETEQFYQALKLRRVDTAMVRIPGASHGINNRPSNMLAQVLNTLAWFERYRHEEADAATTAAP